MRAFVAAALLALSSCTLVDLSEPSPLQVRNQHPVELTAVTQRPRAARVHGLGLAKAALTVDWTSYWSKVGTGRDALLMDGELFRTEVMLGIGLGRGLDLEVRVPMLHYSGGALDSFIEIWHDSFGLKQNQRDEFPSNQMNIRGIKDLGSGQSATVFETGKHGLRVGDIPVQLAWFPLQAGADGGLSVGIRGSLELPTGDDQLGYGNGGIDRALGVLAEWDAGPVSLFTWASHAWIHTPNRAKAAQLRYPAQVTFGFGVAIGLSENLSANLQIDIENSVLRNLDNEHAKRNQAVIWFGGSYRFDEHSTLELGVGEDLVPNVSPDVQFHIALGYRF